MRRLTAVPVLLRVTGVAALVLLLWNPAAIRTFPAGVDRPLILLDASLSMAAGPWRAALDTARALARAEHGVIWRFGDRVTAFDSGPPAAGASRLAPALDAAAPRGGAVIVITDGLVSDAADVPADLRARARVILLPHPRADRFDAFVAAVRGPRRLTSGDTLALSVTVGTAGPRGGGGRDRGRLDLRLAGRSLASRQIDLPDSGTVVTSLTLPAARLGNGWFALELRVQAAGDSEPRDDARLFVVQVSPQPAAVILASPPDWESRFLARTLGEVAHLPLKTYVEAEPGRWRDAATLLPVAAAVVARAAAAARLVAEVGAPDRFTTARSGGGVLSIVTSGGHEGDWYVGAPPPSPLAARLAGIAWDSLPPLAAVADVAADSGSVPVLAAQLARRGEPRPIVVVSERGGARHATVAATGLWRWAFRGGGSEQAYRGVVAALVDFLLGEPGAGGGDVVVPVTYESPQGLPLVWRWAGREPPTATVLSLNDGRRERRDTLRFDAAGRAELRLPPGVYRYTIGDRGAQGLVAVEEYSEEWRPAAPTLRAQPGRSAARETAIGLRDRFWLFYLAIAAFVTEWAWRRRQGLP